MTPLTSSRQSGPRSSLGPWTTRCSGGWSPVVLAVTCTPSTLNKHHHQAHTHTHTHESPRRGNYEVRYTSIARAAAAQQRGQPAGGRFRSRMGRLLFQTTGVFQSVLQPDVATNKVAFKMFGVLPGYVGLRGRLAPVGDAGDTVKVFFDRPVLSFAGCLNLRIGERGGWGRLCLIAGLG